MSNFLVIMLLHKVPRCHREKSNFQKVNFSHFLIIVSHPAKSQRGQASSQHTRVTLTHYDEIKVFE